MRQQPHNAQRVSGGDGLWLHEILLPAAQADFRDEAQGECGELRAQKDGRESRA
jgi:hypothetical protein